MDVWAVMQELAAKASTITGLNRYGYPTDKPTVPALVVGYPEDIAFDQLAGRGSDDILFPVVIVVGKVNAKVTAQRLAGYASGSGAASVKQALETGPYVAMGTVDVPRAEFDVVTYNAVDYAALIFDVQVSGQGA